MSTHISREHRGNVVLYRLWNYGVDDFMPTVEHEIPLAGKVATDIQRSDTPVAIIGHASRTGTEAHNQSLSLRRAETVRDFLFNQGVEAERMIVMAHGESPRHLDGTEDDHARAVRIVIPSLPTGEPIDEPTGGGMSMPRPSIEAMYALIASNPGVESLFNNHLMFTYVPDVLNILAPSSAGLRGPFVLLDVFFHGHAAQGLIEAERPANAERLARDRERVLDRVWSDYTHLLAEEGLNFNEHYEIVNEAGKVVERPFGDAGPLVEH